MSKEDHKNRLQVGQMFTMCSEMSHQTVCGNWNSKKPRIGRKHVTTNRQDRKWLCEPVKDTKKFLRSLLPRCLKKLELVLEIQGKD